jgi:hypothetical protein
MTTLCGQGLTTGQKFDIIRRVPVGKNQTWPTWQATPPENDMILLTVQEYAFLVARSPEAIWGRIKANAIKTVKKGNLTLIPSTELPFDVHEPFTSRKL